MVLVVAPGRADVRQRLSAERPAVEGYRGPVDGANLFPVSVKGVAVRNGRVLLLRNERAEWELPGGKLELGEDPPACVAREIAEESGWSVRVGPILDCWQYHIGTGQDVVIVTYGCHVASDGPPVRTSALHHTVPPQRRA